MACWQRHTCVSTTYQQPLHSSDMVDVKLRTSWSQVSMISTLPYHYRRKLETEDKTPVVCIQCAITYHDKLCVKSQSITKSSNASMTATWVLIGCLLREANKSTIWKFKTQFSEDTVYIHTLRKDHISHKPYRTQPYRPNISHRQHNISATRNVGTTHGTQN